MCLIEYSIRRRKRRGRSSARESAGLPPRVVSAPVFTQVHVADRPDTIQISAILGPKAVIYRGSGTCSLFNAVFSS